MAESQESGSLAIDALDTATGRIAECIVVKDSENVIVGNVYINQTSSSTDNNDSETFQIQRECLMKYYKTKNAHMTSLLWSEIRKDFPLKEYFIELRVQEADLLGKKAGETIQFTEIFPKSMDGHVVMLFTGNPGYGKTTFCKKIAYDWGSDTSRTGYLGHYDFTVVIILRKLENKSITDEILQRISKNTDTNSRNKLRQRGFNLLIILDGFDEVCDKHSIIQFIEKDSFHISKNITILVTCRPHVAENIREYVDMRFIIQGFSQQQKEDYIKLVIDKDDVNRYKILFLIKLSPLHSALAECPLMLHMLCCLPKTENFNEIKSMTHLFIKIFRLVIKRYMRKMKEQHNLKKGKFLYGEDLLVKLGKTHLEKLSKMRKKNITTSVYELCKSLILQEKELREQFPEEKDYQFITGIDIISQYFGVDGISRFDFIHGNFLDFIIGLCYYYSIRKDHVDFVFINFLSGLYGNEKFPNEFVYALQENVCHPVNWLDCYNEIENNTNKKLFCLNAKIYFDFTCLEMMTSILKLPFFPLSQIYFHFTETEHEEIKEKLIDLHNIYKNSDKLEISLFLDKSIKFLEEGVSFMNQIFPEQICDIRQSVDLIQDLINSFKWDKFKIFFSGVLILTRINGPLVRYNKYNFFKDVENPAVIPEDFELKSHKTNKNVVALLANHKFNYISVEIKYLISTEQYFSLKDNIKLSSDNK
ncbi:uncharacterized protein LOC111614792 [Centruroides sculpturatus]|uniref:uncharacterized protein LOC111614792 n=1 Tax=Centruroides sculpturatus TaxID=218467 RepID=UPI000C6EEE94|nr:uncharacterized protein LOC111614792 [Centruroides sculpturatus]XP_023211922.1 uncharacterized protein LOC111614792 [Centruroides sculpturatus]